MQKAEDTEALSPLEAVRKRPGMYTGSTGIGGVIHLASETLANSVDQVLAGQASTVQVTFHDDDSIEVVDDGPGLDLQNERVCAYFSQLHRTATAGGHSPHIHVSSWGVGIAVVNALSTRFQVTTRFDNQTLRCTWTNGGASGGTVEVLDQDFHGTQVRFWPDETIFDSVVMPVHCLDRRAKELNTLIPELELVVMHRKALDTWQAGLAELLNDHVGEQGIRVEPLFMHLSDESDGGPIELRMAVRPTYNEYKGDRIIAYCNYAQVSDRGRFIQTIETTMRTVMRDFFPPERIEPGPEPLRRLVTIASITMLAPEWSGPTKSKLDDPRSVDMAHRLITTEFPRLLESSAPLQSLLTNGTL